MSAAASGHKGNKAALASKPCAVCGRPMSWRRAWAKNWEAVRYCSQACRKNRNKAKSQVGALHDKP
ncbi:DUF2256 domain-containing protein [Thiomonas arsenitoxydans]|uniref:DUF2256 domain-containing protein n=1 Tax=Thiomonas arsenitoxydans (strain DSM 22701 / CIP 110005 / 3As) TaxID=426114 RepID=UPI0005A20032|nr:DUF2256 domain-containing protein [Thiomonas arsenitoxydans]